MMNKDSMLAAFACFSVMLSGLFSVLLFLLGLHNGDLFPLIMGGIGILCGLVAPFVVFCCRGFK